MSSATDPAAYEWRWPARPLLVEGRDRDTCCMIWDATTMTDLPRPNPADLL